MSLFKRNLFYIKMNKKTFSYIAAAICLCGFLFVGCSTPKNVAYFQDMTESVIQVAEPTQIKIQPNDKLAIMVKSMDPALSALFNLHVVTDRTIIDSPTSGTGTVLNSYNNTSDGMAKYTVTPEGNIDFPVLGMLHVAGMTRSELSGFIKGELMGRDLVKDPVVTVEFLNTGFSVLGEVKNPGRYDMNRDQINILEAISLAGDLSLQGQRENIAVIREEADGVHTYRVDLTNFQELSQSPAFYLKQGDIIYVEPNAIRKRETTANGNNVLSTGFWISVASLLTSIVTTIAVFVR